MSVPAGPGAFRSAASGANLWQPSGSRSKASPAPSAPPTTAPEPDATSAPPSDPAEPAADGECGGPPPLPPSVPARKRRRRPRWSLRRRLVLSCVALVAAVCAIIGSVTIFALHGFLYGQLDNKVQELASRAAPPHLDNTGGERARKGASPSDLLDFLVGGGQPGETVGAVINASGEVGAAAVSATSSGSTALVASSLTATQEAAFQTVPLDGQKHTVEIPGLGQYRVESAPKSDDGGTILVGLATAGTQDTLQTLIWVELSVTGAGLLAAGLAGSALMRIALQPLRRVAATATRVSELPLHRGEVALHERVPASDTDPRTEVGQVGAALNRMLGHVGSALHARQESETRVRRFVADASHELRTPLASIRGYAELTHRGREPVGPDTAHALGRIESEAERMTVLVEDLLLLARLDAGRPLSLAQIDLSPLVVDAVSDARAAGPDHHWRLDLPDDPVEVGGDAQRLYQVLTNLLANARTHTPPGVTITARVVRGTREVLLQIEDDGPGIPAELRRHVFERFARGDASRSRAAGSTGLGLAIVHSVVTAHGGEVNVYSVPGRTVFTVTLPAPNSQPVPRLSTLL